MRFSKSFVAFILATVSLVAYAIPIEISTGLVARHKTFRTRASTLLQARRHGHHGGDHDHDRRELSARRHGGDDDGGKDRDGDDDHDRHGGDDDGDRRDLSARRHGGDDDGGKDHDGDDHDHDHDRRQLWNLRSGFSAPISLRRFAERCLR